MLERRQQAEADDVEESNGAAGYKIDAISLDHLLDNLGLDGVARQGLPESDVDRLHVEQARYFLHLRKCELRGSLKSAR